MSPAPPGRVFGLALAGWGLGDLALGRRAAGIGWLLAEAIGVLIVAGLTVSLADTTLYLVPYLAGLGFIAIWAVQAIWAYRRAQRTHSAIAPTPARSPAAAIAWLGAPLLLWGTGFWLVAATSASPAAAVDRFVRDGGLCAALSASATCAASSNVPGVRVRLISQDATDAVALAERVRYVPRQSRFLGIFEGSELVPVSMGDLLNIRIASVRAPTLLGIDLGARQWRIDEVIREAKTP